MYFIIFANLRRIPAKYLSSSSILTIPLAYPSHLTVSMMYTKSRVCSKQKISSRDEAKWSLQPLRKFVYEIYNWNNFRQKYTNGHRIVFLKNTEKKSTRVIDDIKNSITYDLFAFGIYKILWKYRMCHFGHSVRLIEYSAQSNGNVATNRIRCCVTQYAHVTLFASAAFQLIDAKLQSVNL